MSRHDESQYEDLEWAAFRYVAGEMSTEEVKDFETRLAVEQPAREVVARTVQITQSVASLPAIDKPMPAGVSRSSGDRRASLWAAAAGLIAAICTAFAIGLQFSDDTPDRKLGGHVPDSSGRKNGAETPADAIADGNAGNVDGSELLLSAWLNLEEEGVATEPLPEADVLDETPVTQGESADEIEGRFDWVVAAVNPQPSDGTKLDEQGRGEPSP